MSSINIMTDTKAVDEYFELIEELIQCGARKNIETHILINSFIEKKLGMKVFIGVVYGQSYQKPNEVEFHYGWNSGDERFRSKKTIISNIEWK